MSPIDRMSQYSHLSLQYIVSRAVAMQQAGSNESQLRDLMDPFLQHQDQQVPVTDKLFFQAYEHCRLSMSVYLAYASGLVLLTPYFIFSVPFSKLQLYLIYLFITEVFQFYYYNTIRLLLRTTRVYYLFAQSTQHLRVVPLRQLPAHLVGAEPRHLEYLDFRDPGDADHERKVKELSYQIHKMLIKSRETIDIMHQLQFLFYQIAHSLGLLLLLVHDFSDAPAAKNLLIIVVLVGTYQYLEFYLLIIFLLVVLPYYLLRNSYNYALLKYRNYKLQQNLHSQRFSQKMAGDKQCNICLMPYAPDQRVIVLKCNQMHNFHAGCLRQWTKNSVTCPMCRANLCEL